MMALTDEEIILACRQYRTRRDMRDAAPALLRKVYKRNLRHDAFAHMPKERHYLSDGRKEKICSVCGCTKPLHSFHKSRAGRVRGECKICSAKSSSAWAAKNRERTREIQKASRAKNPEKQREMARAKRVAKPEVAACRDMLGRVLRLTGRRKNTRTEQLLGYSAAMLKSHIESQFQSGMTWQNRGEWHIDHIKPVNEFVAEGETDPSVINALGNLRPLWALDNLKRSRSARSDHSTDRATA